MQHALPEHPSRATFDFYFEEFVPEQFLASEDDIRVISLNEPIPTREIVLVKKKGHTLHLLFQTNKTEFICIKCRTNDHFIAFQFSFTIYKFRTAVSLAKLYFWLINLIGKIVP